jgi:hypothetical protein
MVHTVAVMKSQVITLLAVSLLAAGCSTQTTAEPSTTTEPAAPASAVDSPADVMSALGRPITEEFTARRWVFGQNEHSTTRDELWAWGSRTTITQDASGNVSTTDKTGKFVRDSAKEEFQPDPTVQGTRATRLVGLDLFVFEEYPAAVIERYTPSLLPQKHWMPYEAVRTHARFAAWQGLGSGLSPFAPDAPWARNDGWDADQTELLESPLDPYTARTPAAILQYSEVDATSLDLLCRKNRTGTPPAVERVAPDTWTITCADDLYEYRFVAAFDDLGRLVWLSPLRTGDDPTERDSRIYGSGISIEYGPQPSVERPDTTWFEANGIAALDDLFRKRCAKDPECSTPDVRAKTSTERLVRDFAASLTGALEFAEEYSDDPRRGARERNFKVASNWLSTTALGLVVKTPTPMLAPGAPYASYVADAYELSDPAAPAKAWCVRLQANEYKVSSGRCS